MAPTVHCQLCRDQQLPLFWPAALESQSPAGCRPAAPSSGKRPQEGLIHPSCNVGLEFNSSTPPAQFSLLFFSCAFMLERTVPNDANPAHLGPFFIPCKPGPPQETSGTFALGFRCCSQFIFCNRAPACSVAATLPPFLLFKKPLKLEKSSWISL